MSHSPVTVVKGSDAILVGNARTKLVKELLGDGDAGLMVTEFSGDDYEMREVIDAAQTLPFLTDQRIVVAIGLGRFAKADHALLAEYLADPLPSTALVIEWGGTGRVPKAIATAVEQCGGEVLATDPGRKLAEWAGQQFVGAGLRPDRETTKLVVDWLGDDGGKLPGLLAILVSTYGPGARLSAGEVEPFLGEAGGVPPWDLTDAIDKGDIASALNMLRRMVASGRHPMQVMATLNTHVLRLVRLDGASIRSEKEAAQILGMKGSTFPAKKALAQSRKMGHDNIMAAMDLVATADLDLRGQIGWDHELVLEVLIARLARLSRSR